MKQNNPIGQVIRFSAAAVLVLNLVSISTHSGAAEKTATATTVAASDRLAKEMTGTWVMVGTPGKVREAPPAGGRLKFRTGAHWTMTQSDPDTGLVVMHDGGSYTLEGDTYVETIEYANKSTANDIGRSFTYKVKVEGDLMTQIGVGNPYTEVWKRLK